MNPNFQSRMSRRRMLLSLPAVVLAPRALLQTGGGAIRVTGINHVALSVSDVKRSVDFYQGLFGMPVISRQGTAVNLQIGSGPHFLGVNAAGSNTPSISRLGFGVQDFNVDRIVGMLAEHGVTKTASGGPMTVRVAMRDGTPEVFVSDPDGIVVQLQDSRYCGGSGPLGAVCAKPEPSPKKGLIALRDWSHTTNFVSDGPRANKFYREAFGLQAQAYQGPNSPVMGFGAGVHFVMFAGGGGARGGAPRPAGINHLCMSLNDFNTDRIIKILESYGIKPRGAAQGPAGPLAHYISMRMENRGGAKEGTPELYFTDPDGLLIQLQDVKYCGGGGVLGEVCL
jgi:catechol 2,3-dioxygenase-like lactoylglutathione lyase family enzyme